jgi:hypothetical protein
MIKYIQDHTGIPNGKSRGLAIHIYEGNLIVCEMDYPLETHITYLAWSLDMLRKLYEYNKLRRWLICILLGKYAFRELMGLRDLLIKDGYDLSFGYGLEDCEYNKDKVNW